MNTTQITISFQGAPTPQQIASQLRFQAGLLEGMEPKKAASRENTESAATETKTAAPAKETKAAKPAKETKAAKAPKVEPEEENFDLGAEAESEVEGDLGFDEPEAEEEKAITRDDVVKALQAFVKKNGGDRDKAIAVVKKFAKSGSVKDVAAEHYPKIMKALGA